MCRCRKSQRLNFAVLVKHIKSFINVIRIPVLQAGAALLIAVGCTLPDAVAQTVLPEFPVTSARVANQSASGTIDMPVTGLRYEPRVDVQGRNLAEAQADISIRGGTFENTGFKLGAATLGDSQTGHYLAELPVAPAMLLPPRILTGAANAMSGFNAGVGSVSFGWRPITTRGEFTFAAGSHHYNRQSIYHGVSRELSPGASLGADVELARSESDGSVPHGDHDFDRIGARVQLRTALGQTDVFAGYQAKFFGWPNLYTPFGFNETEDIQTVLALVNHEWRGESGDEFSASVFYRRNKDDYEFNRAVPGASNPFEHTTWSQGAAVSGRRPAGVVTWNYAADLVRDRITSTSLVFGRYRDRTMGKFALVPEIEISGDAGKSIVRAGATYDHSNRHPSAWSPIVGYQWRSNAGRVWHVDYAETTQLPTYTALNSSATAGLFRGNPNLGRSVSRNFEAGVQMPLAGWTIEAAAFHRQDDRLVDWTYRRGVTARTANAVDVRTMGFELIAARREANREIVFGYTWLTKNSDYGAVNVDASFYALNFARHRLTLALTLHLGAGLELRSDNEYRVQEKNELRFTGGDRALLSAAGLYYRPPDFRRWEFSLVVDNLWNSDFQEVPAVPAGRRTLAAGVAVRW